MEGAAEPATSPDQGTNSPTALAAAADQITADLHSTRDALAERLAHCTELTAKHLDLTRAAADQAGDAVARAKLRTQEFMRAAGELKAEVSVLHDIESNVKAILNAIALLEPRVDLYLKTLVPQATGPTVMPAADDPSSHSDPPRQHNDGASTSLEL